MLGSVGFIWMLIISYSFLSRLVIWLSLDILGKFILVLMYKIDCIGVKVSLKIDRGVRRFYIIFNK